MAQQTLPYPPGSPMDHSVLNVDSPARTLAHDRDSDSPYPNDPDSPVEHSEKSLVESLMNAEDATSLVVSVLHAILEWLNRLQKGSLRIVPRLGRPGATAFILDFSAVDPSMYADEEPTSPPPTLDELLVHRQTSLRPKAQEDIISTMEYQEQGNRVLQQLDALGSDILARGIGMATGVQDTDPDEPDGSSTASMSELVANIAITNDLLGSPVADLFSFWDAMVQAFVLHPKDDVDQASASGLLSFQKRQLRAAITSNSPARKESAWRIVRGLEPMSRKHRTTYGAFLCSGAPLLFRWDRSLVRLTRRYLLTLQVVQGHPPSVAQLFLAIAYRGVADFVELVKEWTEDVMY